MVSSRSVNGPLLEEYVNDDSVSDRAHDPQDEEEASCEEPEERVDGRVGQPVRSGHVPQVLRGV